MDTVLITGGTGLVGTALSKALVEEGFNVIILTRDADKPSQPGISYARWDVGRQQLDEEALMRADYIVHLAGANVGEGRWTDKRKKEIVDSRVQSGQLLMQKLVSMPNKVRALVSASATGWYGPDLQIPNPRPFVETDPPDNDFLADVVKQWEASLKPLPGKRLVFLRTGIALSTEGGAYPQFKKTLPFGMASILGSGRQMVSWIHIDDLVRLYIKAIRDESLSGVYNAVAPQPASNQQIILQIAKERGKPYIPVHVPAFALKLALGEMSVEVLKSTTVSSKKIEQTVFRFSFPNIESAVKDLVKK